jgi:hypothetical protein
VVQGEKYKKPDGWSSNDNNTDVEPSVTETSVANNKENESNQDNDEEVAFIEVKNKKNKKNNNKNKNKQQQKLDIDHESNAERMERTSILLQDTTDQESDELGYKGQEEHDARNKNNNKTGARMVTNNIMAKKRMPNKARNDENDKYERESKSLSGKEAL